MIAKNNVIDLIIKLNNKLNSLETQKKLMIYQPKMKKF